MLANGADDQARTRCSSGAGEKGVPLEQWFCFVLMKNLSDVRFAGMISISPRDRDVRTGEHYALEWEYLIRSGF